MDVAFLWVGRAEYPRLMVESVRKHLPGARIVQMTDEESRKSTIFEVDEVRRLPWSKHLMLFRMEHLKDWDHTEALMLDADVIVKGDVAHVFEQPFDVALTKRQRPDYPYNAGVMFSRCSAFWSLAYQRLMELPALWDWNGDQAVIHSIAHKFKVLELPCERYNWSPIEPWQQSDALIWHYKGDRRKRWLRA